MRYLLERLGPHGRQVQARVQLLVELAHAHGFAFAVRQVVESKQARRFPRLAAEEFQRRETRFVYGDRHELETKAEYKLRNGGESPNFSDSCMIAVEGARRLGFVIQRINVPAQHDGEQDRWLEKELDKHRALVRKTSLSYA